MPSNRKNGNDVIRKAEEIVIVGDVCDVPPFVKIIPLVFLLVLAFAMLVFFAMGFQLCIIGVFAIGVFAILYALQLGACAFKRIRGRR